MDRRVQKTKASLHSALIGLAREKPYPSIAVKEILNRANIGRSTFYTHFRDKDDLLESGIHEILKAMRGRPRPRSIVERIVAFSMPVLEHINEHRRGAGPQMRREGRVIMHEHLQEALSNLIADELATTTAPGHSTPRIPPDLVAKHVASTFVVVLNWWVDGDLVLAPADVNGPFRDLVIPPLTNLFGQLG